MSDYESTGAISGGAAVADAAPTTGGLPVGGASGDGYDGRADDGMADAGADGSFDDGGVEAPDEVTTLRQQAQDWERRFKAQQKSVQEAVERAKRAEHAAQQHRQQAFTPEDMQFAALIERARVEQRYASPARAQQLEQAINQSIQQYQAEKALQHQRAEVERMRAELAPVKRDQTIGQIRDHYRKEYGVNVPAQVMAHASTPREAAYAAWTWAIANQGQRDAGRTEQLEQEAAQQSRVGSGRGGGGNAAAVQKKLKEVEASGDLFEVYKFKKANGLIKTQRIRR